MKFWLFAFLFAMSTAAWASGPLPIEHENYCRDDVYNYVAFRFGPEVQITKIFHISGPIGMTHMYYFQVDVCEGDIIAVFHGEGWQCVEAQYGRRVQLLTRVYTLSTSCRRFMPFEEFPDLYPRP